MYNRDKRSPQISQYHEEIHERGRMPSPPMYTLTDLNPTPPSDDESEYVTVVGTTVMVNPSIGRQY